MRKKKPVKAKPIQIKRILVPFDFSECSSNALREAIFMARIFEAQVELVHVTSPVYISGVYSDSMIPYDSTFYRKAMKQVEKNLTTIVHEITAKENVVISVKTLLDSVYSGILDHAKKTKTDLIVMGTHGTSGIKEFFAGSNAYRIVNQSLCPVITVQKRVTKKGFRSIVLPIRSEINSRQKVNIVATLAKALRSTVLITGYTKGNDKNEKHKVKQYVNQVEEFLEREAINYKTFFVTSDNFTKAIIEHAKIQKADLIAVMTNHNFSMDQIMSGPYAQQFVNHSKLPVLSVPDTLKFEYSFDSPLSGGLSV